jgi:hypothetical protein
MSAFGWGLVVASVLGAAVALGFHAAEGLGLHRPGPHRGVSLQLIGLAAILSHRGLTEWPSAGSLVLVGLGFALIVFGAREQRRI